MKTIDEMFTARFLESEDHNDPKDPMHWQGFRYGLKTAWVIAKRGGAERGVLNELEAFSEWSKRRQRESADFVAEKKPLSRVKRLLKKRVI